MNKMNNPAVGIVGARVGPDGQPVTVFDEREHFYSCRACGQAVDKRDLGQVFHHEEAGHEPITADS